MNEASLLISLLTLVVMLVFGRHAMRARDRSIKVQRTVAAVENAHRIASESLAQSTKEIKDLHTQLHKMEEEIYPLKKNILGIDEKLKKELLIEIETRNSNSNTVVLNKEIRKLREQFNELEVENERLEKLLSTTIRKLERTRALNRKKSQQIRKLKGSTSKGSPQNKAANFTSDKPQHSHKHGNQTTNRVIKIGGMPANC